jgi:hypothetical protein
LEKPFGGHSEVAAKGLSPVIPSAARNLLFFAVGSKADFSSPSVPQNDGSEVFISNRLGLASRCHLGATGFLRYLRPRVEITRNYHFFTK